MAQTFPPTETLGRTIDTTKQDGTHQSKLDAHFFVLNTDQVAVNIYSAKSILNAGNANSVVVWQTAQDWSLPNSSVKFSKPENIIANYQGSGAGHSVFAETGGELVKKLESSANVSARYMVSSDGLRYRTSALRLTVTDNDTIRLSRPKQGPTTPTRILFRRISSMDF